jgi:tripartite-type tricarboxylate transporter receptor subunit TctC
MHNIRRGLIRLLIAVTLAGMMAFASAVSSHAESWPSRPIKIILPYAPGGAVDLVARLLQEPMGKTLGGTIVVENHSGGAGIPAAESVVNSTPDGYTLGLFSSNYLSNAVLQHLSFDVVNDITPISMVIINTVLILVPNDSPIHTLQDLIAAAKKPGGISYGTPGFGTAMNFAGELLNQRAHIKMVHIPYRGAGPALTDLLAHHIPVAIMGIGPAIPHIRAGKLRAIAITTAKRSKILPDVPTVAELGFPGFEAGEWFAMFGPKGIPPKIVDAIHAALVKATESEAIETRLKKVGLETTHSTPKEEREYFTSELARIRAIAEQAKMLKPKN